MLKTSGSTESTTRSGKGGVEVGGDGGSVAVIIMVMMINIYLEAQDECINGLIN